RFPAFSQDGKNLNKIPISFLSTSAAGEWWLRTAPAAPVLINGKGDTTFQQPQPQPFGPLKSSLVCVNTYKIRLI
ncbi:unnamed protein product, partial [Allacma fusca]